MLKPSRFILSFILFLNYSAICIGSYLPKVQTVYNIMDYGAVSSETILNTKAIQKAIDKCFIEGGGIVYVPNGKFLFGTIFLKSNVNLYLETGAFLLGSTLLSDFSDEVHIPVEAPSFKKCLIFAENAENIAITGSGTIDGRGSTDNFPQEGERPMHIRFVNCSNVLIEGVIIKNSASWSTHMVLCKRIRIEGIFLYNRMQGNNDGIDFDSCEDVFISNCKFDTEDDAICGKSTTGKPVQNFMVTNCLLSSNCAGFKLGTSSKGTYKNITISNCIIKDVYRGAIKLICVDGGTIENVNISDIVMENVEGPFFIRLGGRGKTYYEAKDQDYSKEGKDAIGGTPIGAIRNISISNIRATVGGKDTAQAGIMITGIPGHYVENIHFSNIQIVFPGGGSRQMAYRDVPEDIKRYPEQSFFGSLPSYAIYLRHAKGVVFHDLKIQYTGIEERPSFFLKDVIESEFDMVRVMSPTGGEPLFKLQSCKAVITNDIRSLNNGNIEMQDY